MIHVELELWLGSGQELGEGFQILSPLRSRIKVEIPEGTTLRELLEAMGSRNPGLKELLFEAQGGCLKNQLLFIKNNRLDSPSRLLEQALADGDQVRVLPVYSGG